MFSPLTGRSASRWRRSIRINSTGQLSQLTQLGMRRGGWASVLVCVWKNTKCDKKSFFSFARSLQLRTSQIASEPFCKHDKQMGRSLSSRENGIGSLVPLGRCRSTSYWRTRSLLELVRSFQHYGSRWRRWRLVLEVACTESCRC